MRREPVKREVIILDQRDGRRQGPPELHAKALREKLLSYLGVEPAERDRCART